MNPTEFETKKELDKEDNAWKVKDGNVLYARAADVRHKTYGCPKHLKQFQDIFMWEVGPRGRFLLIGNLRISL